MKRNALLEELRKNIPEEIKIEIDLSFDISERIFYLLQKHNKTQRQFAEEMGKRESEISKWLSGTHNFTLATLAKISAFLGEPIIEIAGKPQKDRIKCIPVFFPANSFETFQMPTSDRPDCFQNNILKLNFNNPNPNSF